MSMTLMAKALSIKTGNPIRKLVLIKLADNANDKGECWPSYRLIADHCECSKTTVRNHIDILEQMGIIKRENRLGVNNGKGNTSNLYYINLDNPMPIDGIPPMPAVGTGVVTDGSPMPADGIPPMPAVGTRTSHSFEPVMEPVNEPVLEKKHGGAKRASQIPDDFKPTDKHVALAQELGVNLEMELAKFGDYHRAKGSTYKDWNSALNNWLRYARDFSMGRKAPSGRSKPAGYVDMDFSKQDYSSIPTGFRNGYSSEQPREQAAPVDRSDLPKWLLERTGGAV